MTSYDSDYKTSYIEGPQGQLQETHFDSRNMLDQLRDSFDMPMAQFLTYGSSEQGIPPLAEQIFSAFSRNPNQYVVEGHLDALTLLSDVLPETFRLAATNDIFNLQFAKKIFDIAGSEGIDTAISYVFDAKPFDNSTTNSGGKLNINNDRFKNDDFKHPETGEDLYKICPGFRVALAIERQLVLGFRRIMANPEIVDLDVTIPVGVSVGDMCKNVINSL